MTADADVERRPDADAAADAETDADEADVTAHLDDLADGAGCTEIWSHLSESREE